MSLRDRLHEAAERLVVGSTELDAQKTQEDIDKALRDAAEKGTS